MVSQTSRLLVVVSGLVLLPCVCSFQITPVGGHRLPLIRAVNGRRIAVRYSTRSPLLSRLRMNSEGEEAGVKAENAPEGEVLDPSQKKEKAQDLRKLAGELEDSASALRKSAVEKEQEAAKLRIEAWQLEGTVSKVTKQVNLVPLKYDYSAPQSRTDKQVTIEDKYERQLAELDLMAEDWIEEDEEKWEWYQKQRQIMKEMIDAQKEYDSQAESQLEDLKETLLELQAIFNIQTVDDKGEITSAGYGFVLLSVVIPVWLGYELFSLVSDSSAAFFAVFTNKDPFDGL